MTTSMTAHQRLGQSLEEARKAIFAGDAATASEYIQQAQNEARQITVVENTDVKFLRFPRKGHGTTVIPVTDIAYIEELSPMTPAGPLCPHRHENRRAVLRDVVARPHPVRPRAEAMTVRWNRSEEGYTDSKDGRFSISPLYMGTTRPQGYQMWDNTMKKRVAQGDTQAEMKREAQHIVDKETKEANARASK
jgi:hypothetical protein